MKIPKLKPNMSIHGFASLKVRITCVDDIYDLAEWLRACRVDGSNEADSDFGHVYVTVADSENSELIECGEHIPSQDVLPFMDLLVPMHHHDEEEQVKPKWPSMPGPENWLEALEQSLPAEAPSKSYRESLAEWLGEDDNDWRGDSYAR